MVAKQKAIFAIPTILILEYTAADGDVHVC
jgi:hypothetical protein